MFIIEILKVIVFGIVEGITEWLPISSTGHLILLENILPLNQSEEFWYLFKVMIQLGAILAVVVLYWDQLWPFNFKKSAAQRRSVWEMWFKIIIACIPAAVIGLPLDDILDEYLSTPLIIAIMLILYGIIFIVMENRNKNRYFPLNRPSRVSYKTAFLIGLFQCLSLIPGTSRSGATIIGAMLLGCSRPVAAEFSFLLGIPTMFGASFLRLVKHGLAFSASELFLLILSMVVSFIVALFAISYLMKYIRKHDFKVFGIYRIILGFIVILWFNILGH